jgi:uncharacterized protein (UPF0332 family)
MTIRPLLPDDLLMLAYRLAGWDSRQGRPRTIELRRAVSTAYYALFRGWTWTAAAELLGHPSDHRVPDVCRWINHSDVLELLSSVLLAQGELSRNKANTAKHIEPMLPRPLDPGLVMVSRTFRHLQEQRHAADYDDRYDITKRSALERVTLADRALSVLWNLHEQRDPGLVLLLKLGIGGVKVAKTR